MSNTSGDPLNKMIAELAQGSLAFSRLVDAERHGLSERKLQTIDKQLAGIIETLTNARYRIDPAKHDVISITLGRPDALSRFFAFNFTERPRLEFASVAEGRFYGSGAYAL